METFYSVISMFDDSKERSDWNGFHSLTTLKTNATVGDWENSASGGQMEFQVPLFDLDIDAGDGIKFVITTSDGNGNYDSTNIINSATKQEQRYIDRVIIARQNANDNRSSKPR